ncbi:DEAD/DEAH box helicase [Pontibacillus yanchengensis]|uniref:DEAD/DEAH box helicase n=1 Tax=Pontibacillus yanchengensis TaxID=462910 RepID=A0A6I5A5J5_9BACI|nr:type I restriction endonuclease [Pontibacillus yanchengensis]MYL35569.1 DEAD/DEAH box helicase [Pontibacillus yanchengensis]
MKHEFECHFEERIERDLIEAGYGSLDPQHFDKRHGVFIDVTLGFIYQTQPEKWDNLVRRKGDDARGVFLSRLNAETEKMGLLRVLRDGLLVNGITFNLVYFEPETTLNQDLARLFAENDFRVTRQLAYSRQNHNSLDLVLSINGIPIVTMELKNEMTGQNVDNAIHQYKQDRDPSEPIFIPNRRSLVHFAVDTKLVYMTTKLRGEDTMFLPFNRGSEDGAGNPLPNDESEYATSYLWKEVLAPTSLLDIIRRYMHVEGDKVLFPRFHQLDAVRKLSDDARQRGAGMNYLIQHSAGSGKSNSIAWLSYRLASLHDAHDNVVFDSIVIITDRKALDEQLKNTIYQFERTSGVVEWAEESSQELARYLERGVKIIITTLQKFPFALERMRSLPNRNYAVIVDEAHSSQSGEAAEKVRETLGNGNGEITGEDMIGHEMQRQLDAQGKQANLSFFAFTATPKKATMELFGTLGAGGSPEPFHVYSMKQAIEEGFIMDVLSHYTEYKVYYDVVKRIEDDPDLDKRKGHEAITRYVREHPRTIEEKARIMLQHLVENVIGKIGGKAKAMLVTASRAEAVRYKLAFDRLIAASSYQNLHALVAFSDSVEVDGDTHTEESMNGIKEAALPRAFDEDNRNRLLIAANKYQTGFDQPLLHTMYVDKQLHNINAVQTLSRLNRTHPDKTDTLVMDFANDLEHITEQFEPFYKRSKIDEPSDPDKLHAFAQNVESYRVFYQDEVESYGEIYFELEDDDGSAHARLDALVQRAFARYGELEEYDQHAFRAWLSKYVKGYHFVTQLIPFDNPYYLKLYVFGKRLYKALQTHTENEAIDVSDKVDLGFLKVRKVSEDQEGYVIGDGELKGDGDSVSGKPEKDTSKLSEIIEHINELFSDNEEAGEQIRGVMNDMVDAGTKDEDLSEMARANGYQTFLENGFNDQFMRMLFQQSKEYELDITKTLQDATLLDLMKSYVAEQIFYGARNE